MAGRCSDHGRLPSPGVRQPAERGTYWSDGILRDQRILHSSHFGFLPSQGLWIQDLHAKTAAANLSALLFRSVFFRRYTSREVEGGCGYATPFHNYDLD